MENEYAPEGQKGDEKKGSHRTKPIDKRQFGDLLVKVFLNHGPYGCLVFKTQTVRVYAKESAPGYGTTPLIDEANIDWNIKGLKWAKLVIKEKKRRIKNGEIIVSFEKEED